MRRSVRTHPPESSSGVRSHITTQLHAAALTDPGRERQLNEDALLIMPLPAGGLFAVADGMGGHAAGDVASQLATDRLREAYQYGTGQPPERLARAVEAANLAVYQHATGSEAGMGTTLTAVLIDGGAAIVANVGDSRAYLQRAGTLTRLTRDHSWVAEQVRQGFLSEQEARAHQWRNVVSNALGGEENVRLDLLGLTLQPGDRLLVCSDGLTAVLDDPDVARILTKDHPPGVRAAELIDASNAGGGPDNITVIIIDVLEVTHQPRYALPTLDDKGPVDVREMHTARPHNRLMYAVLAVMYLTLLGLILLPQATTLIVVVAAAALSGILWRLKARRSRQRAALDQ